MELALLVDFGSTYTKVVAVDLAEGRFVGRAQAPSTVEADVTDGLQRALGLLKARVRFQNSEVALRLACSSAAGGLRMVAVGLVPQFTAEAANRAALGAGAKVIQVYDRELTRRSIKEIEEMTPDIILLAGGTNGGNREVLLHNARRLADSRCQAVVVVAGNVEAQQETADILRRSSRAVFVSDNVMPTLNVLSVEPARERIREVFVQRIVEAKGLNRAKELVGPVVMPTPLAVLQAGQLLTEGTTDEAGWGDLVVVDVGGATTDVHSLCWGMPASSRTLVAGLPEPFAKRTVEGDLGLRVNARSIVEVAQDRRLPLSLAEPLRTPEARLWADYLVTHPETLPVTGEQEELDTALAQAAVYLAMGRHAGYWDPSPPPQGYDVVQVGKDLTPVATLIGTGGVAAAGPRPQAALEAALSNDEDMYSLRPRRPRLYVDQEYILYAAGLLATVRQDVALRLMKSSLRPVGAASAIPGEGQG